MEAPPPCNEYGQSVKTAERSVFLLGQLLRPLLGRFDLFGDGLGVVTNDEGVVLHQHVVQDALVGLVDHHDQGHVALFQPLGHLLDQVLAVMLVVNVLSVANQNASGTAQQEFAAMEFADHLGLAFQIRDDMLDVIGDAAKLGKATGMDETKNTFVRLYGLEKCEELVKEHTDAAIKALDAFADNGFMKELALSLVGREA